ncbi:hypothetical protein FB45DRAFT_835203 [Roridomyces roridus]|uniref:Uncharacterized protein n=1 Tax=Roridomyces roridus TaxID=1738132 RepID=A0AAD7FLG9_9AGAR|nr:hypothetical protein FB45DRAFT_835203 [Roridomyces roridus]
MTMLLTSSPVNTRPRNPPPVYDTFRDTIGVMGFGFRGKGPDCRSRGLTALGRFCGAAWLYVAEDTRCPDPTTFGTATGTTSSFGGVLSSMGLWTAIVIVFFLTMHLRLPASRPVPTAVQQLFSRSSLTPFSNMALPPECAVTGAVKIPKSPFGW